MIHPVPGCVAVIDHQFSGKSGSKRRPVFIFGLGSFQDDIIILQMTSKDRSRNNCCVEVNPSDYEIQAHALHTTGYVRVDVINTITKDQLIYVKSPVSDYKFNEIKDCFRVWYGL